MRDDMVLLAAVLLSIGCSRVPGDGHGAVPVVIDLAHLFEASGAGPRTGRVDLADPANQALLHGWSEPVAASDGSRGAIIEEFQAVVDVRVDQHPPKLELVVERAILRPEGSHRPPRGIRVFMNGLWAGQLRPHEANVRMPLRPGVVKPGRNVLSFRYIRPPRTEGDRPNARYVFKGIELRSPTPPEPSPSLDEERALVLPPGTTARLYVRVPPQATLRATTNAGTGQLAVRTRIEGGKEHVADAAHMGAGGALDMPLSLPEGAIAELAFEAVGTESVRLAQPRIEGLSTPDVAPSPPAGPGDPMRRNLVLYIADTLRADRLGAYGCRRGITPNLDRFAEDAVVFEHVVAESSWTRPSVATMLTGRFSRDHGVATLRDNLRPEVGTLAAVFRAHGYATAAFVTNVNVAPGFGFGAGFDEYHYLREDFDSERVHVPADELHRQGLEWLDAHRDRPFLLYLHATDVHSPYRPSPAQRARFVPPNLVLTVDPREPLERAHDKALGSDDLTYVRGLYDAEVAMLDAAFGELLSALEARGLAQDTVVVFVGDHGEEFHDHGGFEHGTTLFGEVVDVPLIVRVPGGSARGGRVSSLAQHVDVMPTLLAVAGLPIPPELPGRALLAANGRILPAPAYEEGHSVTRFSRSALMALIVPPWKVLLSERATTPARVYDLEHDPAERNDVAAEHPVLVGWARQRLAELGRSGLPTVRTSLPPLDAEMRERLRKLGYVPD